MKNISYITPNFEREWQEAMRYPFLKEMGFYNFLLLANNKSYIKRYSEIKDKLSNVDLDFHNLEPEKKLRFYNFFYNGVIEYPIALKINNDKYDLMSGNTRIAGLIAHGFDPLLWIIY